MDAGSWITNRIDKELHVIIFQYLEKAHLGQKSSIYLHPGSDNSNVYECTRHHDCFALSISHIVALSWLYHFRPKLLNPAPNFILQVTFWPIKPDLYLVVNEQYKMIICEWKLQELPAYISETHSLSFLSLLQISSNSSKKSCAHFTPIIKTRADEYKHVQYVSKFSRYFHRFFFRKIPRQCSTPLDQSLQANLRKVFPGVGVTEYALMSPVTHGRTETVRNWTYKSRLRFWNKLWFCMWVTNMNIPFYHRYEYRGSAQSTEWTADFKITATAPSGEWVK